MKRLVVCCDGTWARPDSKYVTNVEKIARTIQIAPDRAGGATQLVYYISGVGGGSFLADRLLGGAFGFGLAHNVVACYRFLAQNYEPGDDALLAHYVNSGSDPIRHNPLSFGFRLHNLAVALKIWATRSAQKRAFVGGMRSLQNDRALSVRVASSAMSHYRASEFDRANPYEPVNLQRFSALPRETPIVEEAVTALPEKGVDLRALATG